MADDFIYAENDFLKKAKMRINSEENRRNVKLFEPLDKKYRLMQKAYAESFDEWLAKTANEVRRKEYARGGATIHRGYYSPSMMDIVTGGLNRGKLLKKVLKNRQATYTYYFDKYDQLIRVDKFDESIGGLESIEFLEYKSDAALSFSYDMWDEPQIRFFSECVYDENKKLVRYENALCGISADESCVEINVEVLNYNADDLVDGLMWYRFSPKIPLVNGSKYKFFRNEQGHISAYTVAEML